MHRCRVTAGISHQPRLPNLFAIDFRQAVYRFSDKVGAGVAHAIPFFPLIHIFNTKIRRQVDDFYARIKQGASLLHGNAIRCGEKHHIALIQMRLVRVDKTQIHVTAQAGKHLADRLSRVGTGSNGAQFHLWMQRQQPQQFHPGITCATNNSNLDHVLLH